ncbi:MAG: TetR/AcrR family transcriptional regulator [Acidiferrobacter sp.]
MTAALRLFVTRGYFNTTMRDIGSETELSAGAIYYHFESKEDIAKSLFDDLVTRMGQHFDDIEARYSTAHDRCRAVIDLLFQITEEEPAVMEYMLHIKHFEFLEEAMPVCSSRPFRQMRAMVHKGMKSGEVRSMDPTVAANAVYGGALRMISMRLDGLVANKLQTYREEVWVAAWRSVSV